MRKIITIIVILIITIILTPSAYAQAATLSLSPSSGTFNQSCTFSLKVELNTNGAQVDGVDAILLYDPTRFTAKSITAGTIFPDYPGNNIDEVNGKITVSGLASVSTPFTGQGTLVTVNFTTVESAPVGVSQIKFDFDPNNKSETRDSNVVERGTEADLLNSVVNGNYTVGTGACQSGSQGISRGGTGDIIATPTAQPKTLDQFVDSKGVGPGTPELTVTLGIVGVVLTILGVLGLALL